MTITWGSPEHIAALEAWKRGEGLHPDRPDAVSVRVPCRRCGEEVFLELGDQWRVEQQAMWLAFAADPRNAYLEVEPRRSGELPHSGLRYEFVQAGEDTLVCEYEHLEGCDERPGREGDPIPYSS